MLQSFSQHNIREPCSQVSERMFSRAIPLRVPHPAQLQRKYHVHSQLDHHFHSHCPVAATPEINYPTLLFGNVNAVDEAAINEHFKLSIIHEPFDRKVYDTAPPMVNFGLNV